MKESCPTSTPTLKVSKREGNVALWKADIDQRAGEAKAMQKSERKCHCPGQAGGQTWLPPLSPQDLTRQEKDAQCDAGLDRRRRYMDNT